MVFIEVKTEKQVDCLVELVQEIWPEVFIPIIGKDQVDYMLVHYQGKDIITCEIENGTRYFLAEQDGIFIGYFAFLFKENDLSVSKIYLKKEKRGLGLSTKIFSYFEEEARKNKKEKLILRVNRNNKQAIDVYLHRGFEIAKSIDQPLGDRFVLNDYVMEKNLSAGLTPLTKM